MNEKQYLGDGVYIQVKEYGEIWLTTEDGVSVTNTIVLDSHVIQALVIFLKGQRRET